MDNNVMHAKNLQQTSVQQRIMKVPGNKAGGITTLEEKSLGCVQKGGTSKVVDVIDYGDKVTKKGLTLQNGPGNDIVAVTNLMAAGVHVILFTTGRGTPVGSAVPTVKIATNSKLAEKKSNWIDFDAGRVLDGNDCTQELVDFVIDIANGQLAKNEIKFINFNCFFAFSKQVGHF